MKPWLHYTPVKNPDGTWTALLLNNVTEIGPYLSQELMERDLELIDEHLKRGSFGGKAR